MVALRTILAWRPEYSYCLKVMHYHSIRNRVTQKLPTNLISDLRCVTDIE